MKKIMMTLAVVLCCAMFVTVAFTACGDDNDVNTPANENKATAVVMNCDLTVNDDMFNYLDLTVEYYDTNGKVQSEPMTAKNWKKTIQTKLPATLGARLKLQLKSDVDPSSLEKFTEDVKCVYSIIPVNASGNEMSKGDVYTIPSSLDMPGNKVADWVARHADGLVKFLYIVDANGQVTKSAWQ